MCAFNEAFNIYFYRMNLGYHNSDLKSLQNITAVQTMVFFFQIYSDRGASGMAGFITAYDHTPLKSGFLICSLLPGDRIIVVQSVSNLL